MWWRRMPSSISSFTSILAPVRQVGERDLVSGGRLFEGLREPVVELLAVGDLSEVPAPYPWVA